MTEPPNKVRRRVTQACEPCRRKKGRCGGEKPTCSLCARLEQPCTYATTGRGSQSVDQVHESLYRGQSSDSDEVAALPPSVAYGQASAGVETKLDEILHYVRKLPVDLTSTGNLDAFYYQARQYSRLDDTHDATGQRVTPRSRLEGSSANHPVDKVDLPPSNDVETAARLYLRFCHCQPLPLFRRESFASTLTQRNDAIIFLVLALVSRFEIGSSTQQAMALRRESYIQSARSALMQDIFQNMIELSTLQGLCMLALFDYHNGNQHSANVLVSLAVELCKGANLELFATASDYSTNTEEHVRTLWSIVMLQYLIGSFGIMSINVDVSGCRFPCSDGTNTFATDMEQPNQDHGVVAYALQMTEVWYKVRQWVQNRGKTDGHPPWSQKSQYSSILFHQMDIESQMPQRHRFKPSGFTEQLLDTLATNRLYWAPWLYLQIIYHAIVCSLNHPILLSIHLRRFKVNQVPELFLQHTADMISSHTDWLIHLLEVAKEKQFEFSDPVIGHCVAIVATIFLQQSYTQNVDVRFEKQAKFATCMQFVEQLGKLWPSSERLAQDLHTLEATISRAYDTSSLQNTPNLSKQVDLTSFWNIIDLTSTANKIAPSMFGASLRPSRREGTTADVLSTTLLPEPTRVESLPHNGASASSTPYTPANAPTGRRANHPNMGELHGSTQSPENDFAFSADNYFALGQDFVGRADDWFTWDGT